MVGLSFLARQAKKCRLPSNRLHADLSHIATMRLTAVGNGMNGQLNGGPVSFVENWTSEGDFDHVRLIYMVDMAYGPLRIGAAAMAANSRLVNNPSDEDGRPIALTPVTFNNGGVSVDLEEQTLDFLNTSNQPPALFIDLPPIPGVLKHTIPVSKLYFSDWIKLVSVARSDGGAGRLVHIRTLVPAGSNMRGVTTTLDGKGTAADSYPVNGRSYQTCFLEGDCVIGKVPVQELDVEPRHAQGRGLVYGIQFISRLRSATVQMVGDSIGSGYGGKTNNTGSAQIAASRVSRPELPVYFLQSATYAQPSLEFYRAAVQDLSIANISVAVIQTWSGNDTHVHMTGTEAQAAADGAWQRAIHYGKMIRRKGGTPIYLSAVPQITKCITDEQEAARLSSVVRCQELAGLGELVIDMNKELGNGERPANYASQYLIDQLHPNQHGQEHIASIIEGMFRSVLN